MTLPCSRLGPAPRRKTRRIGPAGLAVLWLLALTAPAAANIPPPGWEFVSYRNVLELGGSAPNGDYRFFVAGRRLAEVKPGGEFNPGTIFPPRLIAVPAAHIDRWLDILAAHDNPRSDDAYRAAREKIPGFATVHLPRQRAMRPSSSPLRAIRTVFRIVSIEDGTIRFTVSGRRVDADGRPIGRSVLALLGIAVLGLTGLVLTVMRRFRAVRGAA